jgi:hypothetical protein
LRQTLALSRPSPGSCAIWNAADHELCSAPLTIGEPIIDWNRERIGDDVVRLAEHSASFREMLSCWDPDVTPPDFQARLPIRPDESIGGGRI